MNFLAHIYLSGNDKELQIGNFIADAVKGKYYTEFPLRVQQGITLHRKIDSYTDSHPIVKKSVSRLSPKYGHYGSVIVDILYDHFLANYWSEYSAISLDKYVSEFYSLLKEYHEILPKKIQDFAPYMFRDNWLLSYATIPGIGRILYQMNRRTKNRSKMNFAIIELEQYYNEFEAEFRSFFSDVEIYTKKELRTL